MIYLYGFTDGDAPAQPGLGGHEVEALRVGRVAALAGTSAQPPEPNPEALWRHEAVLEAVHPDAAVLPARFGTVLADEAAVRALLARHEEVLARALEHVRGHVEVGVRIRRSEAPRQQPPATAPETGRAYLLRRRAEVHDLVDAAEAVHEELRRGARDAVRRRGDGHRQLLVGAYLVARGDVDALVARMRDIAVEERGLQLVSTGPWPPYHFVPVLQEAHGG